MPRTSKAAPPPTPVAAGDENTSTALEDFYDGDLPRFVPDFGVWRISLRRAARLVVADIWFSGQDDFGVEDPPTFDGDPNNATFIQMLASPIQQFEARLIASVEAGQVKAEPIRRDFDGKVIADRTHIHIDELQKWLAERDYEHGDVLKEFQYFEAEIAAAMIDEAGYLRAMSQSGIDNLRQLSEQSASARAGKLKKGGVAALLATYKQAVTENERLKAELAAVKRNEPAKVDRPITSRARRTLLTIIAALCEHTKLDPQGRGTAQRIREAAESLGAPVDDETIRNALREIDDALEARMK
jgi:hypothetical protein